jgi:hypothetical protein
MVSSVGVETVEFKTKLPLVGKVEIYLQDVIEKI